MPNGIHSGHRKRMKDKYLKDNFDNMNQHEALEMLLYYAIPQKDTNLLAHKLLDHFGSLSGVFDASVSALVDFGLTVNTAILLKFIPDFSRLYLDDKREMRSKEINIRELPEYFKSKFIGRTDEMLYCLLLDGNFNQIYCELVSKGSPSATEVPVRRIVELSLLYKPKFVVLAHNHPIGLSIPSINDIDVTKKIYKALNGINVNLLDHIVISNTDHTCIMHSIFAKKITED